MSIRPRITPIGTTGWTPKFSAEKCRYKSMPRAWLTLLLLGLLVPAHADPEPKAKKVKKTRMRVWLRAGARYAGSNTVSYTIRTTVRQGERTTSSTESAQRTERFVDDVVRANESGVIEVKRNYLRVYTKMRDSEGHANVRRSPMQGRSVVITESRRRRQVVMVGRGTVDTRVRRVAGMELDWRDIFPEAPVAPGDSWSADVSSLARRLAAYLRCGTRSRMKVRYEEDVIREGSRQAKLYVDWTVEGMRDRHLYTKVTLAGDVFLDMQRRRVDFVDLTGSMIVRGAVIANGKPRIVKGEGQVVVKTTIKPARVEAAAKDEE